MKQWVKRDLRPGKGAKQDKHRRHQAKCAMYKKEGLRERHKLFHLLSHVAKNPNDGDSLAALKALKADFVKNPGPRGHGLAHCGLRY